MPEHVLEKKNSDHVTKIESVSIRAVDNGFIVDVNGTDDDDEWASDQNIFLNKQDAMDFMDSKIGA